MPETTNLQLMTDAELHRGVGQRLFLALSLALLVAAPLPAASSESPAGTSSTGPSIHATRDQVISAFLLNCLRFGSWPQAHNPMLTKQARIGLVVDSALDQSLEELGDQAQARWFAGGSIEIVRSSDPRRLRHCHIVFLGRQVPADTSAILEELRGLPILLVSDQSGFLEKGGCVELSVERDKLGFSLSLDQLAGRGLDLASKMKDLATTVVKGGKRQDNPRRKALP